MCIHSIFIIGIRGYFEDVTKLVYDVFRLVRLSGHNAIADLKARDFGTNTANNTQIAIANESRIVRRTRYAICAFKIAPICSDLKRADLRFNPDLISAKRARIKRMLFNAKVSRTVEYGFFHKFSPFSILSFNMIIQARLHTH